MPMFQDPAELRRRRQSASPDVPDGAPPAAARPIAIQLSASRRLSEESIRTDLCEGPLPDSPPVKTPNQDPAVATSDRAELIERLKRGESPTWIPNRHLESLFHHRSPPSPTRTRVPSATSPTALLPAADITGEQTARPPSRPSETEDRLQDGLGIERPRSALHSGDFTQHSASPRAHQPRGRAEETLWETGHHVEYSSASWLATSPPRHSNAIDIGARDGTRRPPARQRGSVAQTPFTSHRSGPSSLSSSFSCSFAYVHPTSPLVQSESNDDADFTVPMSSIDIGDSVMARNPRRHTLASHDYGSPTPRVRTASAHPPAHEPSSSVRREGTYPYQAHQPRRSLTSFSSFSPGSTGPPPGTPAYLRSRRPSFGSDSSPLQHASMVGSYEESILRGRMSTTPSRPLDFLAQIGVLGIGKCKPSLRCPPHVTLPFSAVFYSYSSTSHGRSNSEDGPSPYVGMIDLENGLAKQGGEANRARRKLQSRSLARRTMEDQPEDISMGGDLPTDLITGAPSDDAGPQAPGKAKRRSASPRAPPGGSYRIPGKGQLQIIIKNQNKTAVKLFLVPYDLAGMDPGTKTFIRQRIFSAGIPIGGAVGKGPSEESSGAAAATAPAAPARPILRYLIHLHICCPSKGRYYLYKSVRVVFANRVPDGKEKLRSEVTFPEPRFSTYKPTRVMHPPAATAQMSGPAALLAADKAFRRRSSGFMLDSSAGSHMLPSPGVLDMLDGGASRQLQTSNSGGGRSSSSISSISRSHHSGRFAAPLAPVSFTAPGFFAASTPSGGGADAGGVCPNTPVDPSPVPLRLPRGRLESVTSDGSDSTTGGGQTTRPGDANEPSPGPIAPAMTAWPGRVGGGGDDGSRSLDIGEDGLGRGSESVLPPYSKLSRGDVGYGGNAFAVASSSGLQGLAVAAEGLLSQRLRSLGVRSELEPVGGESP
ncbi:hypothetical protein RB595_006436 [Gaeumannomyces hyphopodioides]